MTAKCFIVPNGRFMYVINELLNTVTLFDFLPDSGMLIEHQTIATRPPDFKGASHTADLKITPEHSRQVDAIDLLGKQDLP